MKRLALLALLLLSPSIHAAVVRLGRDVVPRAQGVSLTLDPRADSFIGSTVVELQVNKADPVLRFHAEDMKIVSLRVNGREARFEAGEDDVVTVTTASPLQPGRATLSAEFTAPFNRQAVGLYKMVKGDDPYLFTQFQAIDARKAFPSWDEPSFKLPYQLTLTIPKIFDAVSNTPVASLTDRGDWKTIQFAATKPLPSYLVAFAVGQFDSVPIPGMSVPGRVVTPKGQAHLAKLAVEITPPILSALEKYFAAPHPFEKVDLIAVPEYWAGAMENPGAITFRDTILLLDRDTATPSQRRTLIHITAHELAHMWFGDLVTMEWWDDFWLNESFADWMGDKITDQLYPQLGHGIAELEQIENVMNTDARPSATAVRNPAADPMLAIRSVGLAYNKGKAILSMFERWIGPEKFRQGVLDHLRTNAWGNADAPDFWTALGHHAPESMTAAMASFIQQPGLPLVTVEPLGGNRVRLSQRRFTTGGQVKDQLWQIPVALRLSAGGRSYSRTVLLDRASATVTLEGPPDWIFPHADAAGYYRWQMPETSMTSLASRVSDVLTPREKVAFIGNVSALFRIGLMSGDTYLDALNRFASDPAPEVTRALLPSLAHLRATFVTQEMRSAFATYVRGLLRPALDRIGMTPRPGERETVTQVRPELIEWLGGAGDDAAVRAFAKEQAASYLADPSSVHPTLVTVSLSLNAIGGDVAMFEEYRRRFETAPTPVERARFLAALGEFRAPEARAQALRYSLQGPLRTQEFFSIASHDTSATDEERARTFEWALANYDAIVAKLPRGFGSAMPNIAGGCDERRLEAARKFFSDEKRRTEALERSLMRVVEGVRDCVTLREREMAAISGYLTR